MNETAEEKSEPDDLEEVSGPLVFSCVKCRTLVGDSFSFHGSSEKMRTVTLIASSNIKRSLDVYTSKSGNDVGSTYFQFTCLNCQSTLGRYYLTSSKDLDDLREKFTFDIAAITSYELGKPMHVGGAASSHGQSSSKDRTHDSNLDVYGIKPAEQRLNVEEDNGDSAASTGMLAAGTGGAIVVPSSMSNLSNQSNEIGKMKEILTLMGKNTGGLNTDVLKIQHVLVDVLKRLETLEDVVWSNSGSAGSANAHTSVNSARREKMAADRWQDLRPQYAWEFGSQASKKRGRRID